MDTFDDHKWHFLLDNNIKTAKGWLLLNPILRSRSINHCVSSLSLSTGLAGCSCGALFLSIFFTSISIRSAHPRLKSGATFLYADFFLKLY